MIKKFGMENAKNISTPIGTNAKLDKDEEGKEVDSKTYRSMIGSLLYLTASRPDILFAVGMCARYQSCAKESHLAIVKRILRYIKGTLNVGLWYPRNQNFDLIGYTDSDYAGCKLDRKSTSGGCQFLGSSLVSWSSRKQSCVALSTTEAEYVALGGCVAQLLWMMHTLKDYELNYTNVKVLCDNMTVWKPLETDADSWLVLVSVSDLLSISVSSSLAGSARKLVIGSSSKSSDDHSSQVAFSAFFLDF
ncbi:secreted RxLR effector protein 161-like [Curcuma longa]|uniref:secreted RxLR effector protein 161-like n=1 Tax=Curcuma longa TaxID=136217 RepID=UPI003D9DCB1C